MIKTTVGQFLVNDALPPAMRDYNRVYDKQGLDSVLTTLAKEYPDQYRKVTKQLSDIGGEVAFRQGGLTFGLEHLIRPAPAEALAKTIRQQAIQIYANDKLTPEQKKKSVIELLQNNKDKMAEASYGEALKAKNPLALQASLGFRGDKSSITSQLGADLLYSDYKGDPIPFPVTRSFSQGLSPMEYLAATYGARMGVVSTKIATAEAGALNKQITQAAHEVVVSGDDDESDWHTGGQLRGLPVAVDDPANVGTVLSHDVGGYKKNTILTPKIIKDIQQQGVDRILVRSPLVGGMADGGIHARDAGVRNTGSLPVRNTYLGIESGQAIGEPLSQLQLCLAEGTMVRMADWSIKPIEEIEIGDTVMGSDAEGNLSPTTVVNKYDNGVRECVRTVFGVGGTKERLDLVSTADHKLLSVSRRWGPKMSRRTYGIQPVSTKCLGFAGLMPKKVSNDGGRREPFALLFGLLLGDGCYTKSVKTVHFSCFDPKLIEDTASYLDSLGLKASKLKGHPGYYNISQLQDSSRARDVATGRLIPMGGAVNPIKKELIRRGMYGKYAHEKLIPDDVWSWDQQSVAELIAGYFATDGSVFGISETGDTFNNLSVNFSSTSIGMLSTIRQLLAVRFGIYATIPNKQTKNRKRPSWSISINRTEEILKFQEAIPLYGIKKLTFEKLVDNWKPTKDKNWSLFFRKSQTPVGLVHTYDIEVANEAHLFQLANGLIVSNSAKHGGGIAGASKVGGFKLIEALANPPKHMPYGATHAQLDGTVESIETNPAGGHDVFIGGKKHYVSGSLPLTVKKGDTVEAGDVISDGTPNPREVIRHKGIGEGRRYLMNTLQQAYKENRIASKVIRRNIEPVVRGLVDHVVMNDFWNDHNPDDVVKYSHIEKNWQPRTGFALKKPSQAVGKYLEEPVLHHSIGTKIRPSMLAEFEKFKVGPVMVHHEPPPFEPHMLRATENLQYDPDWQVRLGGQYLQRGLLDAAHRGLSSSTAGTSFIPGLIRGDSLTKPPSPSA